jgi:hypothetical protein
MFRTFAMFRFREDDVLAIAPALSIKAITSLDIVLPFPLSVLWLFVLFQLVFLGLLFFDLCLKLVPSP